MMWQPDTEALAADLTAVFGLSFDVLARPAAGEWPLLELRPAGIPREISFAVEAELGWRSITCRLQAGAFAGPLVEAMGDAGPAARATFEELAAAAARAKAVISLTADGAVLSPLDVSGWPSGWQRMSLSLVRSPAAVNTEDSAANDRELAAWCRRFLSLALSLMPVEELEPEDELPTAQGLPEGAKTRIEVNRYERSRINREACLQLHGYSCLVCDFNFGNTFGDAGEGFIHVHHVVPVSRLGPGYCINPATDLIPLCPNCHAMAHRFEPPASVDQLRAIRQR